MHEFVKPGFAVWPWAGHFPSLGLSGHLCRRGTIIAVLTTSQGRCGSLKQHWADFFSLSIKSDIATLERVPRGVIRMG